MLFRKDFDQISVVGLGAPSCDGVRYKCSVMHSDRKLNYTGAEPRADRVVVKIVTDSAAGHEFKHKAAMSRK